MNRKFDEYMLAICTAALAIIALVACAQWGAERQAVTYCETVDLATLPDTEYLACYETLHEIAAELALIGANSDTTTRSNKS